MVQYFFTNHHMLKEIYHTYQVLIQKITHPQTPVEYRPISLCNVSYKIISKILANRLKPFLSNIISPTQTAYVPGRHIHKNVIIAQELLHTMKTRRSKDALVGLKLDMSKAFDRLEWSFLLSIFRNIGFYNDWIAMIDQCIYTKNTSLLINGSPTATFTPSRGIRQRDSLLSYLFMFIMEAFSSLLQSQIDIGHLTGIKVAKHSPTINHLFFTDDCLLIFQANNSHMHHLHKLLQSFGQASGQVINMQK